MKLTKLDGLVVRCDGHTSPVRIHAPPWYRIDRHLSWWRTPKERRASVSIRFLRGARIEHVDVRGVKV